MIRAIRYPAVWLACCLLLLWTVERIAISTVFALPEDEAVQQLLEKSLSVVEIDKEIERVARQREELGSIAQLTEEKLASQMEAGSKQQQEAGKVLRAYYMGERDVWLGALFSYRSLTELLAVYDYFEWIFKKDRQVLATYQEQVQQLRAERDNLHSQLRQLTELEQQLNAQRIRLAALEQDIESGLASMPDSERLRLLMEEMTAYWQTVGLTEVKHYFRALAQSMKELPGWLKENPQYVKMKGFKYTVKVPEEALNEFLRGQNEMFNNFAFRFLDGAIQVEGKREGMSVALQGRYTLENEPVNAIRFHVDELRFNKLALPDTTRKALEEEFDLSFYPQLLVKLVQAESVEIQDGELIIELKLTL